MMKEPLVNLSSFGGEETSTPNNPNDQEFPGFSVLVANPRSAEMAEPLQSSDPNSVVHDVEARSSL